MTTTDLKINGLTCNHCALSVTEELQELPGVTGVDVDVVPGGTSTATVTIEGPAPSPEDVKAAVEEAGYTLAAPGLELA
jgi:copper chaperone